MGEIAEMMLDGTLCASCGIYIGKDAGHPIYCVDCYFYGNPKTAYDIYTLDKNSVKPKRPKVACRICGKMVKKGQGIKDHLKVQHG